nr:MAG TPA: hypothetical protein [Caudoviricetes sp.]
MAVGREYSKYFISEINQKRESNRDFLFWFCIIFIVLLNI